MILRSEIPPEEIESDELPPDADRKNMPDGELEELRRSGKMKPAALLMLLALSALAIYKAYLFSPVWSALVAVLFTLVSLAIVSGAGNKDTEIFAENEGFENPQPDKDFWLTCPVMDFFCHGTRRYASRCLRKKNESGQILIFDYFVEYMITGSSLQTVCVISDENCNLPDFILMKKNLFSDLMKKITPDSSIVHFDDQQFSEKFILKSKDPLRTRAFFSEEVRNYFSSKKGDFYLEVHNNAVLFHRNQTLETVKLTGFLNESQKIILRLADRNC